ncbi:MAG: putative GPN-loop GTPase 3 [Streblomastix strix]|uniref:GPN-loop GTPase 3 n=1 Tax=Streblomastix strix TaxID=222440 RepID=A0A5J4X1X1_9EUKA|nr:MAG: putative GPN-loop GTPase 3 [Streblomastix strix]
MRIAQIVCGPAGCGKSTFCNIMYEHLRINKRIAHVMNLDPAAETFKYPVTMDIRSIINVQQTMEKQKLGPNGSLVYCMEYLLEREDWLHEQLDGYDDDYLILDMPGQIELYTHMDIIRQLAHFLQDKLGYHVCALYLLDSHFITDAAKFVSGALSALSAMIQLEVPHLNVLTKCDLLSGREGLDQFLDLNTAALLEQMDAAMGSSVLTYESKQRDISSQSSSSQSQSSSSSSQSSSSTSSSSSSQSSSSSSSQSNVTKLNMRREKFHRLNRALCELMDEYSLVSFVPLDITDEESIERVLMHIDTATQYGEDVEPREPKDEETE